VNARLPDDQLTPNALAQRRYREDPEKRRKAAIRNRINYALKRGTLVKLPCICGSTEVEAHHYNGYDLEHALDVVWLCKRHHEILHKHRAGGRPRKVREEPAA
jgi:hypothetical protein